MKSDEVVVPIGLIRATIISSHLPQLLNGVGTHEPALLLIAELVRHSDDDDHIRSIVAAALPESYTGNTLNELGGMIEGARRKGIGTRQVRRRVKRKPIEILGDLFEPMNLELFNDPSHIAYIGLPAGSTSVVNVPIASDKCSHFLQGIYFRSTGAALPARDRDLFTDLLSARALFVGRSFPAFVRVGGEAGLVCHDLARDDGAVIEITATGYRTSYQPSVKMIRNSGMRPLPLPRVGDAPYSGFDKLRRLFALEDKIWPLVLAFILGALRPNGPYAFLAVEGEQGSGKSTLCEMCKRIVDPSIPMRSSLPDSVQDLMIIAKQKHVLIFDNLSGVRNDMSDALASLSTKAGFETRQLYTNGELFRIEIARPFALNGIGEYIHRPDLMDRAIALQLEAMPPGGRRTEDEMWREFEAFLPELLHDLYTAVAHALRTLPVIPAPTSVRMADAAHWFVAAEQGAGLTAGAIISAIERAQLATQTDLATNDSLFPALERVLVDKDFEGRPSDLLRELLIDLDATRDRFFPATAAQLSTKLRRLGPALAKAGMIVEFPERTHEGRHIRVRMTPEARATAKKIDAARGGIRY